MQVCALRATGGAVPWDHESVLAFVRDYPGEGARERGEQILCVFSFAHNPVAVTLDLEGWHGFAMSDVFGGGEFPRVGDDARVTLTVGSQGFYWLRLGDTR